MPNISSCRFCNSSNIKILRPIQSPHFDHKYLLYYCLECNSKFHNPSEIDISYDKMYQDIANETTDLLNEEYKPNRTWIRQKNVIQKLLKKSPKSILDVGCRTGSFLMHFSEKVDRVGVELSHQFADVGKKRGLNIYTDFIENIKFDKQFDVVSSYAILEHLTDPIPVIQDLKKLVKKDGLLIILVPWHECLKEKILYKLNIQWHMFCPPSHLNFYSKKFLNDIVEAEGEFELVYSFSTSGGIFNPFRRIPVLNKAFGLFMHLYDMSFMNKIAIFDHLYVYYRRIK